MEYKLFEGDIPYVSTAEFHKDRERAPHVEQPAHRARLQLALDCVRAAAHWYGEPTLSDLGAGDGGFLSMVAPYVGRAWGDDLCPANIAGAEEAGVDVRFADFTVDDVAFGTIVVMTEVLEHMAEPHEMLRRLWGRGGRGGGACAPCGGTDVSRVSV